MRSVLFGCVVLFFACSAQAGPVFKCKGADGNVQFSQAPCPGAEHSERLTIPDNQIGGSFGPSDEYLEFESTAEQRREIRNLERRQKQLEAARAKAPCRDFSSTELRTLTIKNTVVPGMTRADAIRAWGKPHGGAGWQHAYHWRDGKSSYFYIENDCVSSVQGSYGG